jgi:hypothetical protein
VCGTWRELDLRDAGRGRIRAVRGVVRLVLVTASLGLTARVAGATPQARLVYSRGTGAEDCADEHALRRAVAARIGYDPFFPWAPKTVVASMGTLHADIQVTGNTANGSIAGPSVGRVNVHLQRQ